MGATACGDFDKGPERKLHCLVVGGSWERMSVERTRNKYKASLRSLDVDERHE